MDVLLLHDFARPGARPDVRDTLVQAGAVHAALTELGHRVTVYPVTNDLDALVKRLTDTRPNVIFNLVEALAGSDATAVAVPALLDGLGVPYTGTRAAGMALSNDKCAAKEFMSRLALPTPEWVTAESATTAFRADHYIVKARFEHASKDLEDDAIIHCDSLDAAREVVRQRSRAMGRPCFAERFIRVSEFNISALARSDEPDVLSTADI